MRLQTECATNWGLWTRACVIVYPVAGDDGADIAIVWQVRGGGQLGELQIVDTTRGENVGGMRSGGELGHPVVVAVVEQLEVVAPHLATHGADDFFPRLEGHAIAGPVVAVVAVNVVRVEEGQQ